MMADLRGVTWRDGILIAGSFSVFLLVGATLGRWPNGYYVLLRIVVFVTVFCLALAAYDWRRWEWLLLLVLAALLFNPFKPIITARTRGVISAAFHVGGALVVAYAALKFRRAPRVVLKLAPSIEAGLFPEEVRRTTETEAVIDQLTRLKIPRRKIEEEKDAEDAIREHLLGVGFKDVHSQYNVSGYLGLTIDIDIGNGKVGVEVKLGDSLSESAGAVQRLIGQAIYYQRKQYKGNLIVAVVGRRDELDQPKLRETFSFLESLGIACVGVETS